MEERPETPEGPSASQSADPGAGDSVLRPGAILSLLGLRTDTPSEVVWDTFLVTFGDLLHKTARYGAPRAVQGERRHDAAMDAYTFILEKLREGDFRRLRAFDGDDKDAFTRWLVVVARRLCTDFRRQRYGRVRSTTDPDAQDVRRKLVDELWESHEPSELPAGAQTNPEWNTRYRERRRLLQEVQGELEPRDQLLLAYRFDDDMPARQIAQLMGFPTPFHVYRQLNRILSDLRRRLKALGVEDPDP